MAAVMVMLAAAGAASAYDFTAISLGPLTISGGGLTISCPAALSGTIDDFVPLPITGNQIGEVDGATIGPCNNGFVTVTPLSLPSWPIDGNIVLGDLPAPTGILGDLEPVQIEVTVLNTTCLYIGDLPLLFPIVALPNGDFGWGLVRLLSNGLVLLIARGALCPQRIGVAGEFAMTPLTPITIT